MESLMEDIIEDSKAIINRWTSSSSSSSSCSLSSLFSTRNREEARRYMEAVSRLHSGMQSLIKVNPVSEMLVRAQSLMRVAVKHLEKEFYRILKSNRQYLDPESLSVRSPRASDSITPRTNSSRRSVSYDADADADAMADLKMIADCMISSGYIKECLKIYKKLRKFVIVEALDHLGLENLGFAEMQKLDWEIMEMNIKKWLRTLRVAVTTLFYGERFLCDYVFSSSSSICESAFAKVTLETALSLFGFPENVAKCRKSPEKIFRTLDLYEAISEFFPKIELVFSYGSTSAVRNQAIESLSMLGESVRSMISEFESSISKEASKTPMPCGGVHHLTRYVMNFIVFLADYTDSLAGILTDTPSPLPENYLVNGGKNGSSPVAANLAWLILVLLCKIDAKSRLYNDIALSYIFLANNLDYVIVKVCTSNLKALMSEEDWVAKHEEKLRQYIARFERLAWGDVVTSLSGDHTLENEEEEIFRRFNEAFEEAYKRQSSWVVPDPRLRDEIKVSVARKLIPVYSELYVKYRVGLKRNIRFAPEDIGNYLSDLYFASSGVSGSVSSFISSSDSSRFGR